MFVSFLQEQSLKQNNLTEKYFSRLWENLMNNSSEQNFLYYLLEFFEEEIAALYLEINHR